MNIICDVAGELEALKGLVAQMPKDDIILVGDLNDRGADSKGVIDWAMEHADESLMGNHEHMMIDFLEGTGLYDKGLWLYNGAGPTLKSFGVESGMDFAQAREVIPKKYLEWLKKRPMYIEREGFIITHAPIPRELGLQKSLELESGGHAVQNNVIWNRGEPEEIPEKIQVFGHNSMWGVVSLRNSKEEAPWAYCLDSTQSKSITGLNTHDMQFYQEAYK